MLPSNMVVINGWVCLGELRLGRVYELNKFDKNELKEQLWRRIVSAIGWSDYNTITTSRGFRIH